LPKELEQPLPLPPIKYSICSQSIPCVTCW
jgi:hypothetical protein